MKRKAFLTLIYGILIIAGGIFGYYKVGSFPSLFMGCGLGVLLLISSIGTYQKSFLALFSSVILTAILAFFFLWRFMKTHALMPSGMLAIVSLCVFITLIALPNRKSRA